MALDVDRLTGSKRVLFLASLDNSSPLPAQLPIATAQGSMQTWSQWTAFEEWTYGRLADTPWTTVHYTVLHCNRI